MKSEKKKPKNDFAIGPNPYVFPTNDMPLPRTDPLPLTPWQKLKSGVDIEELTPEERLQLYTGPHPVL